MSSRQIDSVCTTSLYVQLLLSSTELKLKCELKSDHHSKSSYILFCNTLMEADYALHVFMGTYERSKVTAFSPGTRYLPFHWLTRYPLELPPTWNLLGLFTKGYISHIKQYSPQLTSPRSTPSPKSKPN